MRGHGYRPTNGFLDIDVLSNGDINIA